MILVVEPDPLVRLLLRDAVQSRSLPVVCVGGCDAALAVLAGIRARAIVVGDAGDECPAAVIDTLRSVDPDALCVLLTDDPHGRDRRRCAANAFWPRALLHATSLAEWLCARLERAGDRITSLLPPAPAGE